MDLRSLLPMAPALIRPALKALIDRIDELERRLAVLESRAVPGANHPPL